MNIPTSRNEKNLLDSLAQSRIEQKETALSMAILFIASLIIAITLSYAWIVELRGKIEYKAKYESAISYIYEGIPQNEKEAMSGIIEVINEKAIKK